jgi:hypothetical protein
VDAEFVWDMLMMLMNMLGYYDLPPYSRPSDPIVLVPKFTAARSHHQFCLQKQSCISRWARKTMAEIRTGRTSSRCCWNTMNSTSLSNASMRRKCLLFLFRQSLSPRYLTCDWTGCETIKNGTRDHTGMYDTW